MNTRRFTTTLLAAGVLAALAATPALAQTTGTTTTTTTTTTVAAPAPVDHDASRLSQQFTQLAGSPDNAQSLVNGLRNGTAVTLVTTVPGVNGAPATTTSSTFMPDTGKMGNGNVKIALSLAEANLAKAGITDPTSAELAAALNGGTLVMADGTSVKLDGVLAARAAGQGWGQIAKASGFKLGDVMRSPKGAAEAAEHGHVKHVKVARVEGVHDHAKSNRPERTDKVKADRPEHTAKADRPDRVAKVDRPERPERPSHPDHPDHGGRPGG